MTRWWLILASLLFACGDNGGNTTPDSQTPDGAEQDAPPDVNPLAQIQGTGLCDDAGCQTINDGILEYEPQFALYDDGATKRRWMQLPAGEQIDTTDMDHWVFPVGTKFWKEFSVGGTRVETRFITKVLEDDLAPNSWLYNTYVWNEAQDVSELLTAGASDANGTTHDVPARSQCKECHEALSPGRVLGFQAIQMDFDSSFIDLEDLIAQDKLTVEPPGNAGPRFPLPGTAVDKAALGYLHANCGHCHNPSSSTHDTVDLELLLEVGKLATVQDTPAFRSAVKTDADQCNEGPNGDTGNGIDEDGDGRIDNGCPDQTLIIDAVNYPFMIVPGDPDDSGLLQRMKTTGIRRMPKIMVEVPDPAGDEAITAWINSL